MFNLTKKDFIIGTAAIVMLVLYPYFTRLLELEPETSWLPFILATMTGALFYLPKHCKEMKITNK